MAAIGIEKFGKDHWSLLAYVETRCVDFGGVLAPHHMRCNEANHPTLSVTPSGITWKPTHGTFLRGAFDLPKGDRLGAGYQLPEHDDWDCLDDLECAGLVEIQSLSNPRVSMTREGRRIAALLRAHKADGRQYATFDLQKTIA